MRLHPLSDAQCAGQMIRNFRTVGSFVPLRFGRCSWLAAQCATSCLHRRLFFRLVRRPARPPIESCHADCSSAEDQDSLALQKRNSASPVETIDLPYRHFRRPAVILFAFRQLFLARNAEPFFSGPSVCFAFPAHLFLSLPTVSRPTRCKICVDFRVQPGAWLLRRSPAPCHALARRANGRIYFFTV